MEVSVLGLGHWGTAIANHLAFKGCQVVGWSIEEDVVAGINAEHRNCRYLSEVELSDSIRATSKLEEACSSPIIFLVLPSSVLAEVLPKVRVNEATILASGIKGINFKELLTPLQCAEKYMPVRPRLAVLSGPSFAKDVVIGKPVGLVAASKDESAAKEIATLFSCEWVKVYTSTDPLGVELGGIIKNVIAIAAGVSDGLGLGDSARAGLVTRGLAEMMRLIHAMGGDIRTVSGLSGLGDLVLTATCDTSRNRTVGLRLGQGEKLEDIISSLGSVAEGVKTAPLIVELAHRSQVEMPITLQVDSLLRGQITPGEMARNLITRPLKREFEERS